MDEIQRTYLPAAGRDWALPLYDPIVKLLGINKARKMLLDQSDLQNARRVLDIGCGTGTMATQIKQLFPNLEVIGLDPDPKALARARRKASRANLSVRFEQGSADKVPYPDASFDRVFSSFMFHHLHAGQRENTLKEVRRVLAPGGSFHMLDFARPEATTAGRWTRLLHSSHVLEDNAESRVLTLMGKTTFAEASKVAGGAIILGLFRIAFYQASAQEPRDGNAL